MKRPIAFARVFFYVQIIKLDKAKDDIMALRLTQAVAGNIKVSLSFDVIWCCCFELDYDRCTYCWFSVDIIGTLRQPHSDDMTPLLWLDRISTTEGRTMNHEEPTQTEAELRPDMMHRHCSKQSHITDRH